MPDERAVREYWKNFLAQTGRSPDLRYCFCGYMGPTRQIADELLSLILSGKKTATTSCLPSYRAAGEPIPKAGSLSVITDWEGNPGCVIENTNVTVLPFCEMTFDVCKREGEDGDLASWQATHFAIFAQEGEELGYTFTQDTPIVFEDFKVIYP